MWNGCIDFHLECLKGDSVPLSDQILFAGILPMGLAGVQAIILSGENCMLRMVEQKIT